MEETEELPSTENCEWRQRIVLHWILREKVSIKEKTGETQAGFIVDLYCYVKVNCPTLKKKNILLLCKGT